MIMTARKHRVLLALLCLIGALGISYALTQMHAIGVAHADADALPVAMLDAGSAADTAQPAPAAAPAATAPSPTVQAIQITDGGWSLVHDFGPIWGGMLLVFGLGSAFIKRNESEHWIGEGRTLAIGVGALGIVGAVLEAKLGGAGWAGVLVTLIGAAKLVISPKAK